MPPAEIATLNHRLSGRILSWIFWGILSILLAVYCGRAISDPDFWWHLKSGEVMLNQGSLLNTDPFNFTGDTVVHNREAVILKGYWLWQLAAALLYRIWGLYGIFVLKGVTLLLLTGGILREMRRQSVSPFLQMVLTGVGSVILVTVFALERSQIFSFIFATTLLGMVAQVRLGRQPSWMLPPLMVLWANIHGGFVVGDILLVLFAAGCIIQYRSDPARLKMLLFWAGAAIIASFANPNGWNTVVEVFDFTQQNVTQQISEYKSSWAHFKDNRLISLLWLIVAVHFGGMFLTRRIFWPDLLISAFLICFGLKYLRNEGFIALSMLPMTGWYLDQAGARLGSTRVRVWQPWLLISVAVLLLWLTTQEWDKRKDGWPVSDRYPVKMALFLRDSGFSGHLFNEYDMGGYFNWTLYPKWQSFIDGRGLDYRVYAQFTEIILAGKNYEALLEQYSIDAIALHISEDNVRPQPLLKLLLNNPRWTPVYLDRKFFVLARNSDKNSAAIKRFGMDKKFFLNSILMTYNNYVSAYPGDFESAVCYTELLIYAGKYAEAEVMLSRIERMQPKTEIVSIFRRQIDTLNVKK